MSENNVDNYLVALALLDQGDVGTLHEALEATEGLWRKEGTAGAGPGLGDRWQQLCDLGRITFERMFTQVRDILCEGVRPRVTVSVVTTLAVETVSEVAARLGHSEPTARCFLHIVAHLGLSSLCARPRG